MPVVIPSLSWGDSLAIVGDFGYIPIPSEHSHSRSSLWCSLAQGGACTTRSKYGYRPDTWTRIKLKYNDKHV